MRTMALCSRQPRFSYTVCPGEFRFRGIGGGVNARDIVMVPAGLEIDRELSEYLQVRASEMNISFWDAYNEEMEARALASREALSAGELQALVVYTASNPQVLDAEEECPF